jgi:predicted nuclease of restriction endonuclease-like (RecB) superfamily
MKNQEIQLNDMSTSLPMTRDCVGDIRNIIALARKSVVRHINSTMVFAYWLIGRRIVVEEQKGKRAVYGERLLEKISKELGAEYGNGFGEPHLRNCRLFYKAYPTEEEIRYALRIKLTWTHHRAIMRVPEPKARAFYLKEAEEQEWNTRELERQIRMLAYERVIANQIDEDKFDEVRQELTPETLLKDPCVAEFLNLRENLRGKEKKVEKRIIDHIEKFMLELGKGFALVGRQFRIPIDGVNKYIDLVFYNYILRCFVLVDLKTSKLTSRDIGQMDAYRRMFDALKRQPSDEQTIGILLGTEIDEPEVKYSIMAECERLFATKLMPFLPTKAELQYEIECSCRRTNIRQSNAGKKKISNNF